MGTPEAALKCPYRLKEPITQYHKFTRDFQVKLIRETLIAHHGNRTHAARALGLQRTYLLRLIRDYMIAVPPPARRGRDAA